MAVNSAVLNFNDGTFGVSEVWQKFGIKLENYIIENHKHDLARVKLMNHKSSEPAKKGRKTLRCVTKGLQDKEIEKEEPSYSKGDF